MRQTETDPSSIHGRLYTGRAACQTTLGAYGAMDQSAKIYECHDKNEDKVMMGGVEDLHKQCNAPLSLWYPFHAVAGTVAGSMVMRLRLAVAASAALWVLPVPLLSPCL